MLQMKMKINSVRQLMTVDSAAEMLLSVGKDYEAAFDLMKEATSMSSDINYELVAATHCNRFERTGLNYIICGTKFK